MDGSTPVDGSAQLQLPVELPRFTLPQVGQTITSSMTLSTYTIGDRIGEGHFGHVYACRDHWENDLVAKVLKPIASHETIKMTA